LPTLRAASDPVTRDLYIDRSAEALGVSIESVRREADARGPMQTRAPVPQATRAPESRRERDTSPVGPERVLLRVALHAPDWRSRLADLLRDRTELHEPERRLIEFVVGADPATPMSDFIQAVDGEARMVLDSALREGLGERDIDAMVTGAVDRLDARVLARRKRALARRITVATEAEKIDLLREKAALSKESQKLKTAEWNVFRRGGR
jgi:hypothetical protein